MSKEKNPQKNQPEEQAVATESSRRGVSYFTFGISLVIVLFAGLIAGQRSNDVVSQVFQKSPIGLDTSSLQKTYSQLKDNYDGKLDDKKLIEGANKGLVEAVGDPYTAYYNEKEAKEFSADLEGTFSGIGAELGKKDGKLLVISPLDNSPAIKAGLQANDVIVRVNNEDTTKWSIDKAVSRIKGEKGTTVKLVVLRGDEVKEFTITRDIITDPSVKSQKKGDIGVIRISRFGEDTAARTRKAAQDFKNQDVKGIVVDLRGNGGGYLETAQEMASLWLDSGQTVVTERRGKEVMQTHAAQGDNMLNNMPTVVLIDGSSASASEILAGALKDSGKATLVGEKSYGKGSVQRIIKLQGGAELKVTAAKWYTPHGKNISKEGISPDVKIEPNKDDDGREKDAQLDKALETLQ